MGFLDNLERGIERAVRTAFSTGSSRRIEAVEIASALRRELDEHSFTISAGRVQNVRYAVGLRAAETRLVTAADLAEVNAKASTRHTPNS